MSSWAGSLPVARDHRPWWGNTFSRNQPHAAWMSLGRRVSEVRLGEAVVFSPTVAEAEGPGAISSAQKRSGSPPILDGVRALAAALERAGYETLLHAVAAHTVFLHPDTVDQSKGRALFRLARDSARRGAIDTPPRRAERDARRQHQTDSGLPLGRAARKGSRRPVQPRLGRPEEPRHLHGPLEPLCDSSVLDKDNGQVELSGSARLLRYRAFVAAAVWVYPRPLSCW